MKRRHDWINQTLPERVCLVLECMGVDTDEPLDSGIVYRFTHIANGSCHHPDWLAEFEAVEREVRVSFYTSPADRALAEELIAKGLVKFH